MTLSRILAYLSLRLLMMVLSACSSLDPIQSGPQSTNPNKVVQKARKWLSNYLGVPVGHVKAISVEQVDWPDACLGLSEPGQACATVMVPGYKIIFDVPGPGV